MNNDFEGYERKTTALGWFVFSLPILADLLIFGRALGVL